MGLVDEGASWIELTANLASLSSDIRIIEVLSLEAKRTDPVLLVGGLGGVFQMPTPRAPDARWSVLSSELPHGFVREFHYNAEEDVVVAAILGRGAWTPTGFFQGDRRDLIAGQGARSPLRRAAVGGFHLGLPVMRPVAAPEHLEKRSVYGTLRTGPQGGLLQVLRRLAMLWDDLPAREVQRWIVSSHAPGSRCL